MTLRPEGSQGTKFVIAVGNECLFEAAQPLHTYHISALAVLKRVSDYSKFSLYEHKAVADGRHLVYEHAS